MEKLKILIADDANVIAETIKKQLEDIENIEILDIAEDGQAEYDKIIELKPDLVLTDNQMPKMNGIDVIELVKNSEIEKKPDFILITGDRDISLVNRANTLEVYRILNKPVDYDRLKDIIAEYRIEKKAINENSIKQNNGEKLPSEVNEKISFFGKVLRFLGLKK